MPQVTIIGRGRFGQTLQRLLEDNFSVKLYGSDASEADLQEAYESDTIFYAVPISGFEEIIIAHKQYFRPEHVLIDVLSVKMHPAKILRKYLANTDTQAILTHPMFGPDSSNEGFKGLPIVMDRFKADEKTYKFWKDFFTSKGLAIVELSPEEHDKLAANSIGLTHFLGRLLEDYGIKSSSIDTLGTKKLLEVEEQVCNDTWQLFSDLQHYNPYTTKMRVKLGDSYDKIYNKLLPEQINPDKLTIGIQGGKGSFNDEAVQHYVKESGIKDYDIKYLYTTERVMAALHSGEVDRGLFAIHNSVGGMVGESVEAMAKYKFSIVEEFAIIIAHALMIRDDATFSDITSVMAHPQVFAQCKSTLAKKYPNLELTPGKGELIDHANVAKQLGAHKLPKEVATMGSKVLADLYDLNIVEDNLQDAAENYTSFLMVRR